MEVLLSGHPAAQVERTAEPGRDLRENGRSARAGSKQTSQSDVFSSECCQFEFELRIRIQLPSKYLTVWVSGIQIVKSCDLADHLNTTKSRDLTI